MIVSTTNAKVKRLVNLNQKARLRREEKVFTAEGIKMFMEAPKEWLKEVYVSEGLMLKCRKNPQENGNFTESLDKIKYETVSDEVYKKISDTQTPQGVMCVLSMPEYNIEECIDGCFAAGRNPFFVILEDLQDPGNLGTILRAGEGAGIDGVVMTKNTVDIFNPKVIRSTMGSIYRVPFFVTDDIGSMIGLFRHKSISVYAAQLDESVCYDEYDYKKPSAFLIGSEAKGLKPETAGLADGLIKIPMKGQVESLNAAVAGSILMYEAARQRRVI